MRRAVSAAALTIVGLGALAAFKSTKPAGGAKPLASGSIKTPTTLAPTTLAPTTTTPSQSPGTEPSAPVATTPPTTAAPSTATKTYDGDTFSNQYGPVQVRITVQGKKVIAVDALQMPSEHQRSQYISEQAGPYLQQEALQAQSAQIDIVSGATYTSEGYAQSLQSALDKAHI
jgi:uncharacterized protein with FMN-binding domain